MVKRADQQAPKPPSTPGLIRPSGRIRAGLLPARLGHNFVQRGAAGTEQHVAYDRLLAELPGHARGVSHPAGGRPAHATRPRFACWIGTPGGGPTCGCSRGSARTDACVDTCRCAGRGPWGRCRNPPGLLTDRRLDHRAGFLGRAAEQFAYEALDALIATGEAAGVDEIPPDSHGVAAAGEPQFDGV